MKGVMMNIKRKLKIFFHWLSTDTRGEFRFTVKGHEVVATFSEKPNKEILTRLKEILLGDSHIRQTNTSDIKLKENIKEAV